MELLAIRAGFEWTVLVKGKAARDFNTVLFHGSVTQYAMPFLNIDV